MGFLCYFNMFTTVPYIDVFEAVRHDDIKLVKLFLENCGDVNIQNNSELTPLILACFHNRFKIAELLLKYAAVCL